MQLDEMSVNELSERIKLLKSFLNEPQGKGEREYITAELQKVESELKQIGELVKVKGGKPSKF